MQQVLHLHLHKISIKCTNISWENYFYSHKFALDMRDIELWSYYENNIKYLNIIIWYFQHNIECGLEFLTLPLSLRKKVSDVALMYFTSLFCFQTCWVVYKDTFWFNIMNGNINLYLHKIVVWFFIDWNLYIEHIFICIIKLCKSFIEIWTIFNL